MHWISILWLITNLALSYPLFIAIQKYIFRKALISVTLVDLIYCDSLAYIYLVNLTISIAVIHCIVELEAGLFLNYQASWIYSGLVEFLVFSLANSLIVSGTLRLISLLRNSESAGLQLLGPENIAVVKIRWASIIISAIYELILVLYFDVHSGLFDLFYSHDSDSILLGISKNMFNILFFVPIFVALIINFVIGLY